MADKSVAVLGAGIQGCCIALELAARGWRVQLFDREPKAMSKASFWNEGKLHLGYVFAGDASMQTADLMVAGSTCFFPFFERWVGRDVLSKLVSQPFNYAVMRNSLYTADQLHERYLRISTLVSQALDKVGSFYPGSDPRQLEPMAQSAFDEQYNEEVVDAAFKTGEISIDPHAFAAIVRQLIASEPKIEFFSNTEILNLCSVGDDRWSIELMDVSGKSGSFVYDIVINTLWEERLYFDSQIGVKSKRSHVHRRKQALTVSSDCETFKTINSTTMVLGPYGDFVNFASGKYYVSWYPSGCDRWTEDLRPPEEWRDPLDKEARDDMMVQIMRGIAGVIPKMRDANLFDSKMELGGGAIFAWGATDVDDVSSRLHERYDVGIHQFKRSYFSVDTGKYCLGPLFAQQMGQILGDVA